MKDKSPANIKTFVEDERTVAVMVIETLLQKVNKLMKKRSYDNYDTRQVHALISFTKRLAETVNPTLNLEHITAFQVTLLDFVKWEENRKAQLKAIRTHQANQELD